MRKAVFLDRDDTLIQTVEGRPANGPDEVKLLPGTVAALDTLRSLGFVLVVVSNQGGITLGFTNRELVHATNRALNDLIRVEWACAQNCQPNKHGHDVDFDRLHKTSPTIDAFYICPHYPQADVEPCECRKPKPGMLVLAAMDLDIDLSQSYMVGDMRSDVQAGRAAKVRRTFLINPLSQCCEEADFVVASLHDASQHIKIIEEARSSRGTG